MKLCKQVRMEAPKGISPDPLFRLTTASPLNPPEWDFAPPVPPGSGGDTWRTGVADIESPQHAIAPTFTKKS